jgi:hypothetical protein
MRDLYRCLGEYPPELLQAIAASWHITLPKGDPLQIVLHLGEAMLAPQVLEAVVEELGPAAREVLGEFVAEGGALPGHRLARRHGSVRRVGPARILREQPWLHPESFLEELYFKGLIYRTYGALGNSYGEIWALPQQFQERLAMLHWAAPALVVQEARTPAQVASDGPALVEDMFGVLVCARQGRMSSPRSEVEAIGPGRYPALRVADLGPRLMGEAEPARLALLWRLLCRLRLVNDTHGLLHPTTRAREWLRLSDERRQRSVFLAWRDDPRWDELRLLPALHCGDAGRPNDLIAARRALLQVLARCPDSTWLSLDSFISTLQIQRSDYLRPDGDFERWDVRDAQQGTSLSGFAGWGRVEGELARYILTRSLCWLGLVDVDSASSDRPMAFRINRRWSEFLSLPAEPAGRTDMPSIPLPAHELPTAHITGDFRISISLADSMYERYQLERFSLWTEQTRPSSGEAGGYTTGIAVYQITAESIWSSQNAGIKIAQILSFLRRISHGQVAPSVARSLQAWGGRFGRAIMRKVVLLETTDEHTMQQLLAHPEVQRLLGTIISPTSRLVEMSNVDELTCQLQNLGIWPQIKD